MSRGRPGEGEASGGFLGDRLCCRGDRRERARGEQGPEGGLLIVALGREELALIRATLVAVEKLLVELRGVGGDDDRRTPGRCISASLIPCWPRQNRRSSMSPASYPPSLPLRNVKVVTRPKAKRKRQDVGPNGGQNNRRGFYPPPRPSETTWCGTPPRPEIGVAARTVLAQGWA